MNVRWILVITAYAVSLAPGVCRATDGGVDYLKQIKPLLRERCFGCHGGLTQKSGLRLDTVGLMLRGGDSGAVITPGTPSESTLLQRVAATEVAERMPPEHEGEPLSPQQVKLIRNWIAIGAPAPDDEQPDADPKDHWAFRLIARPVIPTARSVPWIGNPIDAFLARQHEQHGLIPQRQAPRIILLRRLYLDLVGIPPTAEEIAAFVSDPSPEFYENTVNRLLDDPRHGERWGRHWMDIWRYSDWWGLGAQLRRSQQHIWHWRDWIVESLNNDTPYDEMVRLMLAADELHPNDLDRLRATGYLARNYWLFNRNQWMEETVEHVGKGFLGLTFNCAKCHNHKYDPIEQTDYYAMRAFFEPYHTRLDVVPGELDLTRDGVPRVYDGLLDTPTYRYIRGNEKDADKSTVIGPDVPKFVAFEELKIEPVTLPAEAWQPDRRPWVMDAYLAAAKKQIAAAELAGFQAAKTLADAKKRDADSLAKKAPEEPEVIATATSKPNTPEAAGAALPAAEAELKVAELALVAAKTELESVERRIDAMHAGSASDNKSDEASTKRTDAAREKATIAVRAEREAAVARARHGIAAAELEARRAASDKKDAAHKKLKAARERLDQAVASAQAEVKPTDQYTRFVGAKWTPTRFLFSGKDDPTVQFVPQSTGRRAALAKWITDRRNPLTARVAANHIWMRHMGEPLVRTVFDFGRNGARPTHPELLDWLAVELIDSGWSMKHLHQLIVTSAAYRMSSSVADRETNKEQDPDNHYWWRRVPIRLESQLVRDSLLAHAGTLDPKMGGPTVPREKQAESTRRSLYFFHSNNDRNQFLTTFDEAMVTECYRREQSVVPQQALALTNSKLVLDTSPKIAQRLGEETATDSAFVRNGFALLLGIEAGDEQVAASIKALETWRRLSGGSDNDARARFVWVLINHNDFVTLR